MVGEAYMRKPPNRNGFRCLIFVGFKKGHLRSNKKPDIWRERMLIIQEP